MNMRIKFTSVIAVLCTLVYIAVLGIAAYRIYSDIQTRTVIAEQEFIDLVDVSSSSAVLGFMEEPFKEAVHDALFESKTLAAIIVSGPYGSEYALERREGYLEIINNEFRFSNHFGITKDPFFEPLRITGVRNASIQAVYEYIDFSLVHRILFNTLLALSGALAIGLLTLFIDILRSNTKETEAAYYTAREASANNIKDTVSPIEDEVDFEIPDLSPELYEQDSTVSMNKTEYPEEVFTNKLADELSKRNPEQDDMVLLMIQLTNASMDSDSVRGLSEELKSFFSSRAFIFDLGTQGFSVILPGTHLEKAFFLAEEFRSMYLKKHGPGTDQDRDVRVGLSSCSSRNVEAERLKLEAEEALRKAIINNTPVVAFKNDPERYKAYLAKKKTH